MAALALGLAVGGDNPNESALDLVGLGAKEPINSVRLAEGIGVLNDHAPIERLLLVQGSLDGVVRHLHVGIDDLTGGKVSKKMFSDLARKIPMTPVIGPSGRQPQPYLDPQSGGLSAVAKVYEQGSGPSRFLRLEHQAINTHLRSEADERRLCSQLSGARCGLGFVHHVLSVVGGPAGLDKGEINQSDTNKAQGDLKKRPPGHVLLSPEIILRTLCSAFGFGLIILGFQCGRYASERNRDILILPALAIAFLGAWIASASFPSLWS